MELIREKKKYPGGAPKPRLKDIEELESKFTKYVFYKKERKTTHVITTCCHQDTYIENMPRLLTPSLNLFLNWKKHNVETVCPLCGATVTAKAMGKVSDNLYEGFYYTFLTQRKGILYSIHGYAGRSGLQKDIHTFVDQVIKYEPGRVREHISWSWSGKTYETMYTKWDNKNLPHKFCEVHIIGKDILEKTMFKYIPFCWEWESIGRQLTLAAFYPKQVEMLLKLGLDSFVWEMLFMRRKNAAIFNWDAEDPKKAWKIPKPLLKEFMASRENGPWMLRDLLKWQKVDKRFTFDDIRQYGGRLDMIKKLPIKVDAYETIKYLSKQAAEHENITWLYRDYINMAIELERDVTVPRVRYPRDLHAAHDELVEETNLRRKRMAEAKEKALLEKAWENLAERSKKFNFSDNGYFIRVALSGEEVREEGKALCHCVGGYAERHLAGALTILFIRDINAPDVPLYTVEVSTDGDIIQAHGYKNERDGQPSPKKTIPWFFEEWEYWYRHGSKRDANGNPKIKKNRRKAA